MYLNIKGNDNIINHNTLIYNLSNTVSFKKYSCKVRTFNNQLHKYCFSMYYTFAILIEPEKKE